MNFFTIRKCKHFRKKSIFFFLLVLSFSNNYGQSISVCSGNTFNYTKPNSDNSITYTWTSPAILPNNGAITGGSAQTTGQSSVSQVLVNTTNSPATATYAVTTSDNNVFNLIVTVYPLPKLTSSVTPPSICSGTTFNYAPTSSTPNTFYSWSRIAVAGISNAGGSGAGNGDPNEVLVNTTINAVPVTYSYTLTANGCSRGNQEIIVNVNPAPILSSSLTPAAICSGTNFNYTPTSPNANTFSWTRAAIAGISNPPGFSNGNPNISEVLVNTTLNPVAVNYVYTFSNNSSNCSSANQTISVVVNPVPSVTPQVVTASCSGNRFISSPSNVPNNTLYTWTTPAMLTSGTPITGGSAVSAGQLFIGQALTNNSASQETIQYRVTPQSGACTGGNFFVDVTVNTTTNSTAVLKNTNPNPICSGAQFTYLPESATSNSFTWKRFYNANISQGVSNGTGSVSEILTNNSLIPVTVYYAYTLTTTNNCKNTELVAVSVNPPTILSSTLTPVAICSNTIFAYNPSSITPGTNYSWTRASVTGISNAAGSGTGSPNEVLVNITTNPITVNYNYFLNTPDGCTNNQTVSVQVNPTPPLSSSFNPPAVCSGSSFNYIAQSTTSGASFNWSRATLPAISNGAGSGSGSNISEILVDTTVSAVTVNYVVTVSANGCSNNQVVSVVVNPTPKVFNQTLNACSNSTLSISNLNVPAGTQYTWAAPTISPVGSVSGGSAQAVLQNTFSQLLVNQTLNPATATYLVTPKAGACSGSSFTLIANVNPIPIIADQVLAPICSGVSFSFATGNVPTGTTYTWSSPLLTPANSLIGGSAQPISQSSISQLLSSTNNLANTAVYTVTPAANGCPGNTFTLTVPVNPVAAINNIADTICSTASFTIAPSNVPSNTAYTWTTPSSFPFGSIIGGSAQTQPVSTLSQTLINTTNATGQNVYTVSPVSGNCKGPDFTLTITVGVNLPFTANQSGLICSGTTFDLTPVTSRQGTTYTWSVPNITPPGSVLGASGVSLPQVSVSQTLQNLTDVTDTVVYTVLPFNTGCRGNIFTATVRVLPVPKAVITGKNEICRYPFDTITLNFKGQSPWSFNFSNDTAKGTITGITASPYQWVVPAVPAIPSRSLRISNIRDAVCFNTKDTLTFVQKVNALPIATITSLHGNYICNNIRDTLIARSLTRDTVSYQWNRDGSILTAATKDSLVTLLQGLYNVTLTNQFGCKDTASAPYPMAVINQPVIKFSLDSYCIDSLIQFTNLTDTFSIGKVQWKWDFGDNDTSNSFHASHLYTRGGNHRLSLTANQQYCPANLNIVQGLLDIQVPVPGLTLPSVSAYQSVSTPLSVRSLAGYRYQWTPGRGLDRSDSSSVNFNLSATQQYIIKLISPGSCITRDTLLVRVFDDKTLDIFVPKSFTPNRDGVNDILYPYLTGIKQFQYFKVFNRFGKLLFETRNPDTGWDGRFNGTDQPMGIYIWFSEGINNDGTIVQRKGQTLLLR